MPIVTGIFTPVISPGTPVAGGGGTGVAPMPIGPLLPVAIIEQLHDELAAVGLTVVGAEVSGKSQFGTDTEARMREFLKNFKDRTRLFEHPSFLRLN
jgi:hypothetical protein